MLSSSCVLDSAIQWQNPDFSISSAKTRACCLLLASMRGPLWQAGKAAPPTTNRSVCLLPQLLCFGSLFCSCKLPVKRQLQAICKCAFQRPDSRREVYGVSLVNCCLECVYFCQETNFLQNSFVVSGWFVHWCAAHA